MSAPEFPRGTIAAFRVYLNATIPKEPGVAHWQPQGGGRAGAKTRLYGDWLYQADRGMFLFDLRDRRPQFEREASQAGLDLAAYLRSEIAVRNHEADVAAFVARSK